MSRTRRIYRVTATYADHQTVRHYQSRTAAEHRRDVLLGAAQPQNSTSEWGEMPRAQQCVIDVSAPITFDPMDAASPVNAGS